MTKQEQTKQMLKTLCDKFQCSAINRNYMAKSCKLCDVSEYKAEIERLKAEVKQAKIDTLNKVKDVLDNAPNGWAYTTYIDELIEEIEKQ